LENLDNLDPPDLREKPATPVLLESKVSAENLVLKDPLDLPVRMVLTVSMVPTVLLVWTVATVLMELRESLDPLDPLVSSESPDRTEAPERWDPRENKALLERLLMELLESLVSQVLMELLVLLETRESKEIPVLLEPMENLVCPEPPVLMELKENPVNKDPRDLRELRVRLENLVSPEMTEPMETMALRDKREKQVLRVSLAPLSPVFLELMVRLVLGERLVM